MNELIMKAQAGNMKAFEQLVGEHRNTALKMAFKLTGCLEEAEDLIQEAFIRVFRFIKNYRGQCSFTSWLYQIILNLYKDQCSKYSKIKTVSLEQIGEFVKEVGDTIGSFEIKDTHIAVKDQLEKLPNLTKKTMLLKDYYGYSYAEISDILKVSVESVRTRLYRGRKIVKENLKL
ncbi:RNA polymerase sigma factor [Proteinivorax hydrogeniformans]|uniref:RNA polymerase sigma factor n=1 Tax=Proteinivorax hydrogeniformans TaxID=1826727 RepID=A0AAU8HR61_9FIRM